MSRLELYKGEIEEKERVFLICFYHQGSETRHDVKQSAMKAGYPEEKALLQGQRIIKKYGYAGAAASLTLVGITKPYLATKLFEIIEKNEPREQIPAIRMSYNLLGESAEAPQTPAGNTFNGPVMIIQGMTKTKMEALRKALPQPTRQQLEDAENERCQERLDELKAANTRPKDEQAPILDVENSPVERDPETPPDAG